MTATDELRRLLDERGVEWKSGRVHNNNTSWNVGDSRIIARELADGTLLIQQHSRKHLTPEQAIAVTLGEKPRDKTEEWLLKACNQATQDYVEELKKLVQDWQVLYDEPDYGDYYRLRKRMQDLEIEVIDE